MRIIIIIMIPHSANNVNIDLYAIRAIKPAIREIDGIMWLYKISAKRTIILNSAFLILNLSKETQVTKYFNPYAGEAVG